MAPLVIKYWACHGRCRGLFQMLAETSTPYEHVTDMGAFGAAHFGAATANLAPPIVVDGALVLSQTVAVYTYVGKKLGFTVGIDTPAAEAQALQFMTDMNELHSELMAEANAGQATNDVAALQAHLTGSRYKSHLAAIDRMLQGTYFFGGEAPSYVDHYADFVVTICYEKFLKPVEGKSGDTLAANAPKLMGMLAKLRARPSARQLPDLPAVPPELVIPEARVATWK